MPRSIIIHEETDYLRNFTTFDLFFEYADPQSGGGYGFACDEEGNVLDHELNDGSRESLRKCREGLLPFPVIKPVIRKFTNTLRFCGCGSKKLPFEIMDARGIYAGKACESCLQEKKSQFRPDVFTDNQYPTDEPVEPEEEIRLPEELLVPT